MKLTERLSPFVFGSSLVFACAATQLAAAAPSNRAALLSEKLPADFVENCGQWDGSVKFAVNKGGMSASFENQAINLRLGNRKEQLASVRLAFDGASKQARLVGEDKRGSHYNFFVGNDSAKWQTNVATFTSLLYREIYDGVDVRVREEAGRLEYDLMLAPKADLERVIISCQGTKSLEIAKDGALLLRTANGPLRQTPPKTWEVQPDGTKRFVECRFRKIGEQRYGFEVPQRDHSLALVIDPGLEWGTYIGGSFAEILTAVALARDGSGDVLVAGYMNSTDFPGFNDPNFSPFQNKVLVARLSADGTTLRWATLLGGWSGQIIYRGLAAAPDGGAVIVGNTSSPDFPTTPGAFDRTMSFGDAFVARVNAAGGLVFSTLLGGSGGDHAVACGFDPAGNVIVGGYTSSTDFPTTPGAIDRTYAVPSNASEGDAHDDVFITRFTPDGSAVTYSTYIGGQSADVLEDMVVDSQGIVTIVGWITGHNIEVFPTTADAFDRTWSGNQDCFLARLKLDGGGAADLKYSTLIGGSNADNFYSVALDPVNPEVVTAVGMSWADNFPTTPGVFKPTNPRFSDLFESQAAIVARFHLPASGARTLLWASYVGPFRPCANIRATDVTVNNAGEAIMVGLMGDGYFPTTRGAFDRTPEGILNRGGDFIVRMSPDGAQLNYSSYFGGTAGDTDSFLISPAVAYVGGNTVVIAGTTTSADFPVTAGAFDTALSPLDGAGSDGFVWRFATDPDASGDVTVGTPTPLVPSNGATFPAGTLMVRLQWSAVSDPSGIDGYEFQTAGQPDFSNPTPGVSHTADVILPPTGTGAQGIGLGTTYWRVRAYDRAGNVGAWSATSSFTLDAPGAPPSLLFAGTYPSSVVGGSSAVGAVYLDRPAPAGGLTVSFALRYNENVGFFAPNIPIPVSVPASLTVPAGATSAEFPITTAPIAYSAAVDIVCLVNGVGANTILTVTRPGAIQTSDLVIKPATVVGGHPSTGTVTIKGIAPAGGVVVNLRTSHPQAARVPASVTVPAGSRSATFPITTFAVPFEIDSYVDAFTESGLERQYIFVKPAGEPALSSLTLNPSTASGGTLVTATITFNGLEPVSTWPAFDGAEVSVYSSDPVAIRMSPFAYVPSGSSSTTFTFSAPTVPTNTTVNIFAAYDNVTLSKPLTITAGPAVTISSVTLNVSTVTGGQGGIAWVNLAAPAPAGGIAVALSTSDPVVYFDPEPNTFIFPGQMNTMAAFLTKPTGNNAVVNLTARYGNSSASVPLTVNASTATANLWVTGVTLNPNSVPGGSSATGTVTINATASAGGAVVQLDSFDTTVANVPASVTIPAGATSANFTVTTVSVSSNTQLLIYGLLNISQSAGLTVTPPPSPPPTVSGLSLSPSTVVGGNPSTGTVTLSGAAPSGGAVVALSSANTSVAAVSASVAVPAGASSASFPITTVTVAANTSVVISGSYNASTRNATLTVNRPPTPVAPTLASPANNATVAQPVNFDWNNVANAVSYTIQIDESTSFTAPLVASQSVSVSQATIGGLPNQQLRWRVRGVNSAGVAGAWSSTRTFTPQAAPAAPSLSTLALNPTSVVGGNTSQGTVTLTSAAPSGGAVVSLSSANTAVAAVPASVTVAAGATTANFTVTTVSVGANTSVSISGVYSGVTKTASLSVNPPASGGALPAPSLQSPSSGAEFDEGDSITFNWTDVSGAASYTIQIDDANTFPAPQIVNQTVTPSQFTTSTLPARRMWWRARASDSSGNPGAWSSIRSFEVKDGR